MTLVHTMIYFIIYSFLGWAYESLFYSFQFKKLVNTGFLHICICPIYGLACTVNVALFGDTQSYITIFITSMIVISAIEYAVSWLLENIFNKRWWDYSDWPVNLNGRISLMSSLAFGALSLMQMRLIHPAIEGVVLQLSEQTIYTLIILFIIVVAVDVYITLRDMDKDDGKLWFVDEDMPVVQRANERMQSISEKRLQRKNKKRK